MFMDALDMLDTIETTAPLPATGVDKVRKNLEDDDWYYIDVNGDGTLYTFDGSMVGAAYVQGQIEVDGDVYRVRATSGWPLPQEHRDALKRLCTLFDDQLINRGLTVDADGCLAFSSAPLDVDGDVKPAIAAGRAATTLRTHTSAACALEAGVDPWQLMSYSADVRQNCTSDAARGGFLEHLLAMRRVASALAG